MSKFKLGQNVMHVKSGAVYRVTQEPDTFHRLESTEEKYYRYKLVEGVLNVSWIRGQSEMEDGRFEPYE